MITLKMVSDMFLVWRRAGLRSGARDKEEYAKLVQDFGRRYMFLQAEELRQLQQRVLEDKRWPKEQEMVQLVGQLMAENMQGLDYSEPYERQPGEDYDSYIIRLGQALFPRKSAEWYYKNSLNLRIVYASGYCCRHCQGSSNACPYGNRMVGKITPYDDRLVAVRAAGLCQDGQGDGGFGSSVDQGDGGFGPKVAAQQEGELPHDLQVQNYASSGCDLAQGEYPMEAMEQLRLPEFS